MGRMKRLAAGCVALLCLYMMAAGLLRPRHEAAVEAGRMKNVEFVLPTRSPEPPPLPPSAAPEPTRSPEAEAAPLPTPPPPPPVDDSVQETTIAGGLNIKNQTEYAVDAAALLAEGTLVRLPAEGAQILIIHTHSSEAYTPAGLDRYEPSDTNRTEDPAYNIIRVGDELTAIWQDAGLHVIHDRGVYDYPSYTGSYGRSGAAVQQYLAQYPQLAVVIDMHRDALGSEDVVYKIMAEESGVVASQAMLLVGTDASGLEHPNWRGNLSLALVLQQAVNDSYPTLMRPVDLVPQRYNQHLTPGSLILEVGSSGNTLQEALAAIRLFGQATAPALLALVESPG